MFPEITGASAGDTTESLSNSSAGGKYSGMSSLDEGGILIDIAILMIMVGTY